MVEKNIAMRFLNKSVRVKTSTKFYYRGIVTEITNDSIILDDIKVGTVCLSLSSIEALENWTRDKNG